jgi:hypothetical protein
MTRFVGSHYRGSGLVRSIIVSDLAWMRVQSTAWDTSISPATDTTTKTRMANRRSTVVTATVTDSRRAAAINGDWRWTYDAVHGDRGRGRFAH